MRIVLALIAVAGCSHGEDWSPFASRAGRFHVDLPGVPVETVKKQVTVPTVTESHIALVERGARGEFQISYYDLDVVLEPETAANATVIDCLAPFTDGEFTVSDKTSRPLGAAAGYFVVATAPKSTTHANGGFENNWCLLGGKRMYHVTAVGPDSPEQRADSARFIASFRID